MPNLLESVSSQASAERLLRLLQERCDALDDDTLVAALADTDPQVRHRAAELAASVEVARESGLPVVCRALINSNEFGFLP